MYMKTLCSFVAVAVLAGCAQSGNSISDTCPGTSGPQIWKDAMRLTETLDVKTSRTNDAKIPRTGSDAFNGYLVIVPRDNQNTSCGTLTFVGKTTVRVNYRGKGKFYAETTKVYDFDGQPFETFTAVISDQLSRSDAKRTKGAQFVATLNGTFRGKNGVSYGFRDLILEGGFLGETLHAVVASGRDKFTLAHNGPEQVVEFDVVLAAKVHGR